MKMLIFIFANFRYKRGQCVVNDDWLQRHEIKVYGAGIRFIFLYSAISSYKGKNIMLKVGTVNYDRFS